jgi:hypothetical protein
MVGLHKGGKPVFVPPVNWGREGSLSDIRGQSAPGNSLPADKPWYGGRPETTGTNLELHGGTVAGSQRQLRHWD